LQKVEVLRKIEILAFYVEELKVEVLNVEVLWKVEVLAFSWRLQKVEVLRKIEILAFYVEELKVEVLGKSRSRMSRSSEKSRSSPFSHVLESSRNSTV